LINKKIAKKYINFSEDQIKIYLSTFKKLVSNDKYTISTGPKRQENDDFISDYKIDTNKEKEILLSLDHRDFCYATDNENPQYAHEKLYVFCKECKLDYWGEIVDVEVYIKTNVTKSRKGNDVAIVVSFHKLNKPITYLFR
jgi:hypothetical protein